MRARTCNHRKPDGHLCGSLAVSGSDYCYYHIPTVRREQQRQRERAAEAPPVVLPELSDFTSIDQSVHLVMGGMLDGRIASKVGGQLLYALQLARTNLRRPEEVPLDDIVDVALTLEQVMRDLLGGRITSRAAGRLLFGAQMEMKKTPDGAAMPEEGEQPIGPYYSLGGEGHDQ